MNEEFKVLEEPGSKKDYLTFERRDVPKTESIESVKNRIEDWVNQELLPLILEINDDLIIPDANLYKIAGRPIVSKTLDGFRRIIKENSEAVARLEKPKEVLELILENVLNKKSQIVKERVIEMVLLGVDGDLEDISAAA